MRPSTAHETDETVEAAEVLERCDVLAGLTATPGAILRASYTPEHAAANAAVEGWMGQAGLHTRTDAAGNLVGRLEGRRPGLPALLLGSHLDTVPDAGRYDGMLGVLLAVAVAQRLSAREPLPFALEVLAFADEEGARFGATLLGSRAVAGTWDPRWWALTDAHGVSLREAFVAFGLDPDRVQDAARAPQDTVGYLEAHIEQGPVLQDADRALGVVSGISGALRALVRLRGQARHCATPYPRRRDALLGACEAVLEVDRVGRAAGCVVTVGHLDVEPDAVNVVAGTAEFSVDLRSPDDAVRADAWAQMQDVVAQVARSRGLELTITVTHAAPAVHCRPSLRAAVAAGIGVTGDLDPLVLPSVAGHDAMALASLTGTGMLFIRCADGISHHPDEAVRLDDVAAAIDAFEAAVLAVASSYRDEA